MAVRLSGSLLGDNACKLYVLINCMLLLSLANKFFFL